MARLALGFEGITVPADLDGPPELLHALAEFGVAAVAADGSGAASIVVSAQGPGFRLSGPAYLNPFTVDGLDAAAGSVMAGLAACKGLAVDRDTLCIHGAAACVGGRTYLFLAPFGTGKSSLMAELALLGAELLADDVVLLNVPDLSISGLQIPMRLRQGFVQDSRPAMKDWIAAHQILAGARYTYLAGVARAGHSRPLTDIVLLNRAPRGGAAVLEPVSQGTIIPRILWHNMSRHHPASAISRMAAALASAVGTSILHFTDAAVAADQLLRGEIETAPTAAYPPLQSTRRDDLLITRTDRGAIISDDASGRIFEINESAFVILTLLQQVDDDRAVRDMLGTIYPDAPGAELDDQVSRCLRQFADCGLVDQARAQSFNMKSQPLPC